MATTVMGCGAVMTPATNGDWRAGPVHYPDPAIEVVAPAFQRYVLGNAAVERIHTGARWTEGPVWFGDGRYLLWSDIPNNRILRWCEDNDRVSVYRSPSDYCNGNTRDRQGRLISCEHASWRVTRTEYDGSVTVLMDRYQGRRLNAPNDVVVHPDGHIWFSDPGYGILVNYEGNRAAFELPANVYRLDPATGEASVVADDIEKPNGLCFSPDYQQLYITDTARVPPTSRAIRAGSWCTT
ncbi:SMP-30/gluconolactonase/LRE family protein [Synechococcus sp. CCY9201]|uniref:SMP-30/gluconolactonase/LRE family protein n=1 Tax=Synechococcus sp. CCY9201 TaxID=174697 RepID=UPI002B1F5FAE|nr:SMP-30/gluconolactonase/LRE family protein [Synechococcus sp. CCY9201]MEA5472828.1 SMP-30/gluconolactonase/LRE family protein [Synechococcus sp. CCY9201]